MFKEKIGPAATWEALAEECVELAKEALKMGRIIRGENPTDATENETLFRCIEEYTDICNYAMDLGLYADRDIAEKKCKRFEERIEEFVRSSLP